MKGERLDRIRFWLTEQNEKKQTLFPKGKSFVEDSKDPSRMVVIEELAPGPYTLQFLIPNIDSYFEEVPEREVIISANEIVKIDQKIKPIEKRSHATPAPIAYLPSAVTEQNMEASEDENLYTDEEAKMTALGKLTIYSNIPEAQGLIFNSEHPQNHFPLKIQDGEAIVYLPAGEYRLVFDRANVERTLPLPIEIKIEPLQKKAINAYFGLKKK